MTGPLRPCNRPSCRLCNRQPREPLAARARESLPELLIGAAMLVVWFGLLFTVLPIL